MNPTTQHDSAREGDDLTRVRLLHAAGEVFAEHGLKNATTRDICAKANANVAAINYHFGSKEKLYAAVLEFFQHATVDKYPHALIIDRNGRPENRLGQFLRIMMGRMIDPGQPTWYGRLLAREMVDPTDFWHRHVEQAIRPMHAELVDIVGQLLGRTDHPYVFRSCMSIVGQALVYAHQRQTIQALWGVSAQELEQTDALADHIAEFSIAGISALRRKLEGEAK